MTSDEVSVVEVDWAERSEDCIGVRRVVFIEEQSVPEEIEIDGEDPDCRHFLALLNGAPIGAARLKSVSFGVKVQRVAVLKQMRSGGVGHMLMQKMIDAAPAGQVLLDAQVAAIGFYERLGFTAEGEVFMDANIPHRRMWLRKEGRPS